MTIPQTASVTPAVEPYEARLNSNLRWALSEGSRHFEGGGAVQAALRQIGARLNALGVPYAIVGGMALFAHGLRRFTEDVDVLVTAEGLALIHDKLEGLGYVAPFPGSKHLRDTEHGVKIEFLVTGQYPGDGKPKPVSFPDPAEASTEIGGIMCLTLDALITLKLASGMTGGTNRLKDLADVVELIKLIDLDASLANKLPDYVRAKYLELWNDLHPSDSE